MTTAEVQNPTWSHTAYVYVPNTLDNNINNNILISNHGAIKAVDFAMAEFALSTGTVTVDIFNNPQTPYLFTADPQPRGGDQAIAYSWKYYIQNPSTDNLAFVMQLPMVKTITAGFSAVRDFIKQKQGLNIDSYAIKGGSKRGWASWLACAYDTRCVVALSKSFDNLNVVPAMKQHYMALGGWSRAYTSYWNEGVTELIDTHELREISCMIDPLLLVHEYTARNVPIYSMTATGDEFFLHQNQIVYENFHSNLYMNMVPNKGHGTG